jgi:hypothetical protein
MSKQVINVGQNPNDYTGDPLRIAFQKVNNNFDEIYANVVSSNFRFTLNTMETVDGNVNIVPNGTSAVVVGAQNQVFLSNTATSSSTNTGALVVAGGLGVAGRITVGSGVFWANGTPFSSGGSGTGIHVTSSSTPPLSPNLGDEWYNTGNDVLYKRTSDGASSFWLDLSSAPTSFNNITVGNLVTNSGGNISASYLTGNIGANTAYAGTFTNLTVNNNQTISGNATVTGKITVGGNLSVSGVTSLGSINNLHITGGTNGQYIQTDGAGNLTWATGSGGGGGGSPGGSNAQVQFNDSGSFGASTNFTFNKGTGLVTVGNLVTTNGLFWPNGVSYISGAAANQYGNTQVGAYLLAAGAINANVLSVTGSTNLATGGLASVGIGTISPAYKLDVNGQVRGINAAGALTASNGSGAGQTSVLIKREGAITDQGTWELMNDINGFQIRTVNDAYSASQPVLFASRSANYNVDYISLSTNGSEKLRILSNGNVGIGTIIPGAKLQVAGLIYSSSTSGLLLGDGTTFTPSSLNAIPSYGLGYTTSTSTVDLTGFGGVDFYTNQLQRVKIDSNGNMIPAANVSYNLGSTSAYWNNFYASSITAGTSITVGSMALWSGNATITGVTLSGVSAGATGPLLGPHNGTVGATTANTGAFTTLTASSLSTSSGAGQSINVTTNYNSPGTLDAAQIIVLNNSTNISGLSYSGVDNRILSIGISTNNRILFRAVGVDFAGGPIYTQHVIPLSNTSYDLGSNSYKWNNIYGTSIYGTISTAAQTNITSLGTLSSLNVSGSITVPSITHSGTSGVGDIGSISSTFGTVYAQSTTAQYADLAEKYLADCSLEPGEVVIFGGGSEITKTSVSHDTRVAGVISTNPAYIMNHGIDGQTVALTGRTPCKVLGPVSKGDLVVASGVPGVAMKMDRELYQPGCIIGKSLEDVIADDIVIIEIAIGRF